MKLATQVGQLYDSRTVEHDVHYLWSLGRFEDIRVETTNAPHHAVAIVFHTTPRQEFTIHEVSLKPNTLGLKIAIKEGARIDRKRAHDVALDAQHHLQERGYLNARVTYELTPAVRDQVDLKLKLDPGDAVRVRGVEFTGDTAIPPEELERRLHALRPTRIVPGVPHLWNGWQHLPSYTQSAVDADLARLRAYYFFKGYLDSEVRVTNVDTGGADARIQIDVHAGSRRSTVPPGFCSTLLAERRSAERAGVLEFSATANVDSAGQLSLSTELGPAYRVGTIQFHGNRSYSDRFVRRNFVLDEGEPFDDQRLRQSIARLNRTDLFETIDARNIEILPHSETGFADIQIRLTERKIGSWNMSGPIGPISFAGPLQAAIETRLPPWGRDLLELSTYTASFSASAFARPLIPILSVASKRRWIVPVLALQRPYTAGEGWRSGFAIVPQRGWREMAAGYVTTQLEQRLFRLLNGNRGLVPELPVTIHRGSSDTTIVCEPPAPKLARVRSATAIGLHFLGAVSGL